MSQTSERVEPKRLKGFRDYTPDLMARRLGLMDVIRAEARLAGFQVIGTPALEYAPILLGHGEETDKQVYRFTDHGGRDVALRFDLTVPFARFVAEHQGSLVFPFKKLQMGDVWRGENTQKGRYREFVQCDLDIIGVDHPSADIEILAVFQRILSRMAFGPFTMAVGNRVVLSALIRRHLGVEGGAAESQALIAIDKLAKIGPEKVAALLAQVEGASPAGAQRLLEALSRRDAQGDSDLAALAEDFRGDERVTAELARVGEVVSTVRRVSQGGLGRLVFDLTIARGLGYYTGVVFETTVDSLPGFGSICSGGRYNDLASRFSTRQLPGVGGSVGLDRLLAGLEELGLVPSATTGMIFVAIATPDALAYGHDIATRLRLAGLACDVGLTPKLASQFKHADRLGCPFVITVGQSEREQGTYALKSMREGTERRELPVDGVVEELRRALALGQ